MFPSFSNTPTNVTVKTGQKAKLLCEATGYPQPFLSWSKGGGKNFPAARDRRFQVNPENLNEFIIIDVEWQDRGVYYCNATNIAGSIISNATVSVLGKLFQWYDTTHLYGVSHKDTESLSNNTWHRLPYLIVCLSLWTLIMFCNIVVPPMFTEDISCTNTRNGDYLLTCQADGNPKAPIVWYKDGEVIQVLIHVICLNHCINQIIEDYCGV